ncbi:hypothetical protein [Dyadobacter sp. NIV53]|uniref:hypothetical protein n=1 Tax=Dyadobacter sp. NIV53 TaxID=2861765 RepID=UPI001C86DF7E|nr:hypothetical protein [Dyadobacter sp. NIV53]
MIKLCENILGLILKKWPKAKLYVYDDVTLHDGELTITHQNDWFITITTSSVKVSAIFYRITGAVKNHNQGYRYIREYLISRPEKDGRHLVSYLDQSDTPRLVKIHWTLADLIENLELEVRKSNEGNRKKSSGQNNGTNAGRSF